VAATLPQTEATNHTFKSLAFLANAVDSFAPSPHSLSDGFAVAPTAPETEFLH